VGKALNRFGSRRVTTIGLVVALAATGCISDAAHVGKPAEGADLAGAWRSTLQFKDGAFASIKDLEFMYVFNLGGTMTESSNYDGAPPVPPAYGVWRRLGPGEFEAKYEYYATKSPTRVEEITGGGGWLPSGRGVFIERIVVSADGRSFTSTITYDALDLAGKPAQGGGKAEGRGVRIAF
jgi:hypothetical protein